MMLKEKEYVWYGSGSSKGKKPDLRLAAGKDVNVQKKPFHSLHTKVSHTLTSSLIS